MSTCRTKFIQCLAVAICLGQFSGCATWKKSGSSERTWNPSTWFKKEFQEPASMATIWKADRLAEPGQIEKRGFGARVYFYNDKSQAIPVEGDLVVHGYLTTPSSRREPKETPDKKWSFTAEQLSSQFNPSDLGASYSVWVPWDEDGYREEVTLIATFKSKKGGVVQGAPTKIFLPGKSPIKDEKPNGIPTQQVSYSRQSISTYGIEPAPENISSTRITTIDLPGNSRLNRHDMGSTVGGTVNQNAMNQNAAMDGSGVEVGGQPASSNGNPTFLPNNPQTLPPPPAAMPGVAVGPYGLPASGVNPTVPANTLPTNVYRPASFSPVGYPPAISVPVSNSNGQMPNIQTTGNMLYSTGR